MAGGNYFAVQLGPDKNPAHGTRIAEAPANHDGTCPEVIKDLWRAGEVAICFSHETVIRQLSQEGLASVRQKRLRARLEKQVPLFAAEYERRELEQKPDFYAGERDG